jgi:hypothetical protein
VQSGYSHREVTAAALGLSALLGGIAAGFLIIPGIVPAALAVTTALLCAAWYALCRNAAARPVSTD